MTPEEYITTYTRGCSNELVGGGYHEWLTPEEALRAVEIAREGQTDLHKDFDVAVHTQSSEFVNPTMQDICKDCINTKGCVTCKDGNMKETAKKDNTKSKEVLRKLQDYLENATSEELEETWERLKKYNTGPKAISWKEMTKEDYMKFSKERLAELLAERDMSTQVIPNDPRPVCGFGGYCTNPYRDCVNCPGVYSRCDTITTTNTTI